MTRQLFDRACQVAHIRPRIVLESGSPLCLLALVEGGHGIAIIPSTVRLINVRQRVLPLEQDGRQIGLWMSVIWDPKRYVSPPAKIFIDLASRFTQRQYPGKSFRFARLVDSFPATAQTEPVLATPPADTR